LDSFIVVDFHALEDKREMNKIGFHLFFSTAEEFCRNSHYRPAHGRFGAAGFQLSRKPTHGRTSQTAPLPSLPRGS
jgi:hypothetical protein